MLPFGVPLTAASQESRSTGNTVFLTQWLNSVLRSRRESIPRHESTKIPGWVARGASSTGGALGQKVVRKLKH